MWGRRIRFKQAGIAFQPFFLAVPSRLRHSRRPYCWLVGWLVGSIRCSFHANPHPIAAPTFSRMLRFQMYYYLIFFLSLEERRNLEKKSKIPLTSF
jgi:hypothetical protein